MIAIVDYGLGNLFSVRKAFEYLGAEAEITSDASTILSADRIVLPGIGAFGDGIRIIRESKLDTVLEEVVMKRRVPFLGICLGLQLLADIGEEYGEHKGLGWVKGKVRKIDAESHGLKVPHIGWNNVARKFETPLFRGIPDDSDFYFVHSYMLECADTKTLLATTEYGETVTAAIIQDNIFATQFHPEKSQDNGLQLLRNFIAWKP